MKTFDVIIIGAGLAGLQCAKLLSRRGTKILLGLTAKA
ncbi:MAG: NAD(P)-binding protein, partial [Blastocatellia bacterium]|nr:NAD(P)-binding protein [Blastocatellia bacterium]